VNSLTYYQFDIIDGRVNSIAAYYNFPSGYWDWDGNTWFDKVYEPLKLPPRENWPRSDGSSRSIVCQGFSVTTFGSGTNASITIRVTNPIIADLIKERRNAEAEKRRREFTP
jgi:hypothetical protein